MGGGTHRAPPMETGVGGGGDRTPGWGAMGQRWGGESHCGPMESSFSPQSCCSPQIPTDPQNANAAPPDPNVTPPRPHPTPPAAGSSAVPGLISLFFRRGDLGLINPNPAWGGGGGWGWRQHRCSIDSPRAALSPAWDPQNIPFGVPVGWMHTEIPHPCNVPKTRVRLKRCRAPNLSDFTPNPEREPLTEGVSPHHGHPKATPCLCANLEGFNPEGNPKTPIEPQ